MDILANWECQEKTGRGEITRPEAAEDRGRHGQVWG